VSLIGSTIHGNLLIKSLIGEGAMGAVFLAENEELPDRKYAVKVLLNAITNAAMFQERFNEEARNQAGLDHPNIVRVHDYFKEDGRYFLVMDFVDGQPLQQIIKDRGKLDEKSAIEIMDGVLRGLDCAHQHGIVHRDVKPSNILVDKSGRARLTDFGIAIRAGEMRLTATGVSAVGTAAYMSPEQIRTPAQIDHRADVYASGIVLFEMLTGDVPFHGETDFAIHQQQVKARPPNPRTSNSSISARMTRIILLALAKDPRDRIQGCEQFRRMLAGELEPPFQWKPVLLLAAPVLLCIALYVLVPRWQRWMARPKPAPVVIDSGQIRDTALGAVQSFELLCRESAVKAKKEDGKRIAEQVPNSAVAEEFAQQIKESQANMADFAKAYSRAVDRLAQADEHAATLALRGAATDSRRAAYVDVVEQDTMQARTVSREFDAAGMSQSCAGLAAKNP
jgi:tRNA A-37 threonylcarbamoyl transferase component Bud32